MAAGALAAGHIALADVGGAAKREVALGAPVTLEDAADAARTFGGKALRLAALTALPARVVLAQGEAAVLWPLGQRLAAQAEAAPRAASKALERACSALNTTFPCPTLLVLMREGRPKIETLPLGALPHRRFAVFVSGGLLAEAGGRELEALLAREVALLTMYHLHVPEVWAFLQAVKPPPRSRGPPRRPRGIEVQRREATVPPVEQAARQVLAQLGELCRAHHGLRLAAECSGQLPAELRAPVLGAAGRLQLPRPLGDVVDIAAVKVENGGAPAMRLAAKKALQLEEKMQLRRLWRINALAQQAGLAKGHFSLQLPTMSGIRRSAGLASRFGAGPVESIYGLFAAIRNPGRHLTGRRAVARKKKGSPPPIRALLVAFMAARRAAELEADRAAARVLADEKPVVAGLVLLHGTPAERRQLARGDLSGLIEDAQAEELPQRRWATWWASAVRARKHPPLRLRIAELASWAASEEGRRALGRQSSGWAEWFRTPLRRLR